MKYSVNFENKVSQFEPGELVSIDIKMYQVMPGAVFTFEAKESDVSLVFDGNKLEFVMPCHDVNIMIQSKPAGLPDGAGIPMRFGEPERVEKKINGSWICQACGYENNTGKYCQECGEERTDGK